MAQVFKMLWFLAVSFMIRGKVSAYSLADRSDVSNSSEEYGYYNIYNKIDSLQTAFQTLETNVQRKNNMLRQILQPITEMDDNIEMSDQKSQGTTTIQPVQNKDKTVVAFDVRLTSHVSNLSENGQIVFGTVDLNEGKAYDISTGKFTAPASGLYVFDWTIMTQQGKYAFTAIYVNGNAKSFNHCYDGSSMTYASCSKMTVVKLKQGDKVWIGVHSGQADIHSLWTSFSGYKL